MIRRYSQSRRNRLLYHILPEGAGAEPHRGPGGADGHEGGWIGVEWNGKMTNHVILQANCDWEGQMKKADFLGVGLEIVQASCDQMEDVKFQSCFKGV